MSDPIPHWSIEDEVSKQLRECPGVIEDDVNSVAPLAVETLVEWAQGSGTPEQQRVAYELVCQMCEHAWGER